MSNSNVFQYITISVPKLDKKRGSMETFCDMLARNRHSFERKNLQNLSGKSASKFFGQWSNPNIIYFFTVTQKSAPKVEVVTRFGGEHANCGILTNQTPCLFVQNLSFSIEILMGIMLDN